MNTIQNTTVDDFEFICQLFDEAILYQKNKGFPVWNGYDKNVLKADAKNKLQFKIVEDDTILCVFSICFNDQIIWREKEKEDAIYLHRIVVNPKYKGQKQFEKILSWAKQFGKHKNLKHVRMDTWGDNQSILNYYQSYGFKLIENYTTPTTENLPIQHRNLYLALLEYCI